MWKSIKSFDDTCINYKVSEVSDSYIILVHGVGGDSDAWAEEEKILNSAGYSTVAIDLRGHGKSQRPSSVESYSIESFARDVHSVIVAEKITDFVLVGHSFGGLVVITFNHLFPELASAYVLVASSYKFSRFLRVFYLTYALYKSMNGYLIKSRSGVENRIKSGIVKDIASKIMSYLKQYRRSKRNYSNFVGTRDLNLKRVLCDIRHTSVRSWIFTYYHIASFDGLPYLSEIMKPTLILHGSADMFVSDKIARTMHSEIPDSLLKIIPHANHIVVISFADVVANEILSFISMRHLLNR